MFFICPDWHGYFHLKQVCIIHRGVPFMEGMLPMRFCQTRRTLNDSFGEWTFPVSSHSIQNWLSSDTVPSVSFTKDWMSGLPFTNACLIFFFFFFCCVPSQWWDYWILCRGPAHDEMQSVTIYPRLAMLVQGVLSVIKRPGGNDSHFCANLRSSGNWRVPNFDFYSNYMVKTIHRI